MTDKQEEHRLLTDSEIEAIYDARVASDPEFAEVMRKYDLRKEPFEYQRCDNCIYYLNSTQWCDHPDFQIEVGAAWWCNIWRI